MVQSQGPDRLTIGKFASAGGVGVETVRYYQRTGLLQTPPRAGGFRFYSAADVRCLHFIKHAQAAGFTLKEIKELLLLDAGHDRARARELAKVRVKALNAKIAELEHARDALRRLSRLCGEGTRGHAQSSPRLIADKGSPD